MCYPDVRRKSSTFLGVLCLCSLELGIELPDLSKVCILPVKQPFDTGPQLLDVLHHLFTLPLHKPIMTEAYVKTQSR
jgi:hypothetical protein